MALTKRTPLQREHLAYRVLAGSYHYAKQHLPAMFTSRPFNSIQLGRTYNPLGFPLEMIHWHPWSSSRLQHISPSFNKSHYAVHFNSTTNNITKALTIATADDNHDGSLLSSHNALRAQAKSQAIQRTNSG